MEESKKVTPADRGGFLIKKSTMILKNNKKIEDVYNIEKKAIGTGGFGVVSKCFHKDIKQERAVKIVSKKKIKNMQKFQQEIIIL